MVRKLVALYAGLCLCSSLFAQKTSRLSANAWVDSVFKTLTPDEKIAQLMVIRGSSFDPKTKRPILFTEEVQEAVRKYNVGGICMFQGGPLAQANFINRMQSIAKTPILICIDAENGLGMRMDSVMPLPRQMMLGAMSDASIMYEYGQLVGQQCKRIGIQVNYAPVVDVNNNPLNPVINDRSFGEDKYKVADFGIQYMKGMQDVGIMATAKHFPGHGDVSVDSHLELPVLDVDRERLNSLELPPFRAAIQQGVGAIMTAHIYVSRIEPQPGIPATLSHSLLTGVLRQEMR